MTDEDCMLDDELVFKDEDVPFEDEEKLVLDRSEGDSSKQSLQSKTESEYWKIMIVDDVKTLHTVTKIALNNFVFEEKTLNFISAYSGKEAKQLIAANPDTAIVFLDVVMEEDDAGFQVIKYIREELNNNLVRIILRTGQPGEIPEESVILNYDINDYKLKVDLTRHKLITTTIAALRSYRDVLALEQRTSELTNTLQELQQTQLQLVQNEKMAALGQLLGGITHEINNPLSCIFGNVAHAENYTQDLMNLLTLYQDKFPNPGPEIEEEIEDIELDYLVKDLPQLLKSMKEGIKRISEIGNSMKVFLRSNNSQKVLFDLHEGIDSTLMILKHRLKANDERPEIKVITNYGSLPPVECYPGQINQVFMNLIVNAIDALEEFDKGKKFSEIKANPNQIYIQTKYDGDRQIVSIFIKDNGLGMSAEVKQQIFDHLFTTKPVGQGTGLGLSISHQIVVEKHGGQLNCMSVPGEGTEFEIELPVPSRNFQ